MTIFQMLEPGEWKNMMHEKFKNEYLKNKRYCNDVRYIIAFIKCKFIMHYINCITFVDQFLY